MLEKDNKRRGIMGCVIRQGGVSAYHCINAELQDHAGTVKHQSLDDSSVIWKSSKPLGPCMYGGCTEVPSILILLRAQFRWDRTPESTSLSWKNNPSGFSSYIYSFIQLFSETKVISVSVFSSGNVNDIQTTPGSWAQESHLIRLRLIWICLTPFTLNFLGRKVTIRCQSRKGLLKALFHCNLHPDTL